MRAAGGKRRVQEAEFLCGGARRPLTSLLELPAPPRPRAEAHLAGPATPQSRPCPCTCPTCAVPELRAAVVSGRAGQGKTWGSGPGLA